MVNLRKHRRALTVTEVLLALGISGIICALVVTAIQWSRENARRNQCTQNMGRIGAALLSYHSRKGSFPPGGEIENELSWHVLVLSELGYTPLYDSFDLKKGSYNSLKVNHKNNPYGLQQIREYLCPSSPQDHSVSFADAVANKRPYTTHYYGIMGPRGDNPAGGAYRMSSSGPFARQGLLGYESHYRATDITDGASNTFIVGELSWDDANCYRTWVRGVNGVAMSGAKNVRFPINRAFYRSNSGDNANVSGFNDVSLGSNHRGGTCLLMGDGAVRFVLETVDEVVYRSTASINGGEAEVLSW
jgi:type II secretory pathway pseudopilin PulG